LGGEIWKIDSSPSFHGWAQPGRGYEPLRTRSKGGNNKMTWFKRHLNWTLVAGAGISNGLGLVPGFLRADITTFSVMLFAGIGVYIATFAWVLVQKGRSLCYIFLAFACLFVGWMLSWMVFFPLILGSLFGFIVLFCLKNERIPIDG
jgi:hypothetical protein